MQTTEQRLTRIETELARAQRLIDSMSSAAAMHIPRTVMAPDLMLSGGPWVDVRSFSSIHDAIVQLGAREVTLFSPSSLTLTENLTLPATLTLRMTQGAVITVPTGMTLTINGALEAGPYQIFDCAGTGAVTGLTEADVLWFGAVADGSTDCKTKFKQAFASTIVGGLVNIPKRTLSYSFDNAGGLTDAVDIAQATVVRLDGTVKGTTAHIYAGYTTVNGQSGAGEADPKVLYVASTADFTVGNTVMINMWGHRFEAKVIASIQAGVSLTFTTDMTYTHTVAQADIAFAYSTEMPWLLRVTGEGVRIQGQGTLEGPGTYVVYEPHTDHSPGLLRIEANDTQMEGITFLNPPEFSIYVRWKDYIRIHGCNFVGGPDATTVGAYTIQGHVWGIGGNDIIITDNHFRPNDAGGSCIEHILYGTTTYPTKNLVVANNVFVSPWDHCTYLTQVKDATVSDNVVRYTQASTDPTGCAFKLGGQRITFTGNTMDRCPSGGITLYDGRDSIVANNVMRRLSQFGIRVTDNAPTLQTTVNATSAINQVKVYVASTVGFHPGDRIAIGDGTARYEQKIIAVVAEDGTYLECTEALVYEHTAAQADVVSKLGLDYCIIDSNILDFEHVEDTTSTGVSAAGQKVLTVTATTMFAPGQKVWIDWGTAEQEVKTIDSIDPAVSLTMTANLDFAHTAGSSVSTEQPMYEGIGYWAPSGADACVHHCYGGKITNNTIINAGRLAGATAYAPIRVQHYHTITTTVDGDSAAAQTVLNVLSTANFRVGEQVWVGFGTVRQESCVIAAITGAASGTLTMAANLQFEHTAVQADEVEMHFKMIDFDISNNKIVTPYGHGIYLWYVTKSRLSGNTFYNPKVAAAYGVYGYHFTYSTMEGNIARDDQATVNLDYLLYPGVGTDYIEMINNACFTADDTGLIGLDGAQHVQGRGNRLSETDRLRGVITWNGGATKVVPNKNIGYTTLTDGVAGVILIPVNDVAAAVMGSSQCPYVYSRSAWTSFTLKTGDATALAAADHVFAYEIVQ